MPRKYTGKPVGQPAKYAFHKLNVGESCHILWSEKKGDGKADPERLYNALRTANSRSEKRFLCWQFEFGLFIRRVK
jgi:hypothetical protein